MKKLKRLLILWSIASLSHSVIKVFNMTSLSVSLAFHNCLFLSVMSDIVAELSPSDVELLSQCLLMLSDIARQYDHLTPSSQYALQAMQLITDYLTAPEDKSDRSLDTY